MRQMMWIAVLVCAVWGCNDNSEATATPGSAPSEPSEAAPSEAAPSEAAPSEAAPAEAAEAAPAEAEGERAEEEAPAEAVADEAAAPTEEAAEEATAEAVAEEPAIDPQQAVAAGMEAARTAERGGSTCDTAYNGIVAMVATLREQMPSGPTRTPPPRERFVDLCGRLPSQVQECMVMTYALENRVACAEAREGADPRLIEEMETLMSAGSGS